MPENTEMKLALLKPPDQYPDGSSCSVQNYTMPYGILDIQAYLLRHGVPSQVKVLERFDEIPTLCRYEVIGITTLTATCHAAYHCAELIKATNPSCTVVMGGPHCNGFFRQILNAHLQIDAVVVGEGESPMLEIARGDPMDQIPGVASRNPDGSVNFSFNRKRIDLNAISRIDNEQENSFVQQYMSQRLGKFLTGSNGIVLSSSRGCPGKCIFCSSPYTWGGVVRRLSPVVLAERIEAFINRFAIREIFFADDTFVGEPEWMREFCSCMRKFAEKLKWSCLGRVDMVDGQILDMMASAGCRYIKYGIESASHNVMASMGKNIGLEQVQQAVDETKRAGIEVGCGFMVGFPGETRDDMRETEAFAKSLQLNAFSYTATMLFPGTPIFKIALREGKITEDEFLYWMPKDPKKAMRAASPVSRDCQPIYVPDGFTYESFLSECTRRYHAIERSILPIT